MRPAAGFSLLEIMMAVLLLTASLLATGHVFFVMAASESLARSKGTAALAAQNLLESLSSSYQQNPLLADLDWGGHGPKLEVVVNPVDGSVLNRYSIAWEVHPVPDPRAGKALDAKLVTVRVNPVLAGGALNSKPGMNKILNVSTILGLREQ